MDKLSCAFTGDRPNKFVFGYDEEYIDCIRIKYILLNQILALVKNGITRYISGMAQGVDMWAAEIIIDLKKYYPQLELVCVLPCETQADKWSVNARERYFNILAVADNTIYISNHYTANCILERNRFMVAHANFIIAVYNGEQRGSTAKMVQYARNSNKALILINPNTFEVTPFTIEIVAEPNSETQNKQ